jgi:tetratricopeptide (TPR) repeat protein
MSTTSLAPGITTPDLADSRAAQQLRIGLEHHAAGRIDDAIAAYQRGLGAGNESGAAPKEITDLHFRLGNAWMIRGELELAVASYKAALRILPNLTSSWSNLGNAYLRMDRARDAVAVYLHAVALDSTHWPARANLAEALIATRQYIIAKALLLELIAERPRDAIIRNRLGKAHFSLGEADQAVECFQQAIVLDPDDTDSSYWIGSIKQTAGELEAAETAYARAARLRPLIRRPARKSPAEFRVLALYAPFGGNTPTEYLFENASYDVNTLPVIADNAYDVEMLRHEGDIVVNLLSDADQGNAELSVAAELMDILAKPAVNDPRRVQHTTREAVARLLEGIAGCRIPKVLRLAAGPDAPVAALQSTMTPPLLARPAGTHGGDDFEKIESLTDLAAFLQRASGTDHYLIEYVDYCSPDGYFRKYRFIFVNGEILPYHLAIGKDWKIHHDSTDMVDHPWMQREEEVFLNDPAAVFSPAHFEALRAIQRAIGLEYSGIDCGLDRAGQLVVFEVNASMLVHRHNEAYPYKAPAVLRIKLAFDEMLQKLAFGTSCVRPSTEARREQKAGAI